MVAAVLIIMCYFINLCVHHLIRVLLVIGSLHYITGLYTVSIGGNSDSALVLVLCVSKSPSHFFVLYCGLTVWIRRRMAWFSRLILSISFCLFMKFKLKQYDCKVLCRTMSDDLSKGQNIKITYTSFLVSSPSCGGPLDPWCA